jgi:hypothetical protein
VVENERARVEDDNASRDGCLSEDEILALYMRFIELLAGRKGREFRSSEQSAFLASLPPVPRSAYREELDARIHRPEGALLRLHLA